MGNALGFKGIAGVAKQTDYFTAASAPTDKMPFYSESLSKTLELLPDESIEGSAALRALDLNFESTTGSVEVPIIGTTLDMTYKSADILMDAAMGTNTFSSDTNILTLSDDVEAFLTLAFWNGYNVHELQGAFVTSMGLAFNRNDFVKGTFGITAMKKLHSGTNFSQAELEALQSDLSNLFSFRRTTFYIGDQTDILAAGDAMCLSEMNFSLENTMSDPEQAAPCSTDHTDSQYAIQPNRNGKRVVTGDFMKPVYDSAQFETWRDNQTALQILVDVTLSASFTFKLFIPNIRITQTDPNISGAEKLTTPVSFQALKNDSNTVMKTVDDNTITNEFAIEIKNERTGTI